MKVLYIDELFALNFIVDYLMLLSAARVCGVLLRRWRYALGALFGAAYAVGAVLPGWGALSAPGLKIGCGCAMALIAFAGEEALLKCALVFFTVSAAFGGAVWWASMLAGTPAGPGGTLALPLSLKTLVVSFGVCYAVVRLVFHRALKNARRQVMTVAAVFGGRSAVFRALRDTGNGLYDPVTGSEVLVVSAAAARPLFPQGCAAVLARDDPVAVLETLGAVPELKNRLRLIPYSAVGAASGLLPVFRPDSLMVDGKKREGVMIAVAPALDGGEYEAVL